MRGSSLTEFTLESRLYSTQKLALGLSQHFSVINSDSASITDLYAKAKSLYELYRFQDCIDTLNELLKLQSGYKDAYFLKALAYRKMNMYQNSLQNIERCLKIDPKNHQYFYYKGLNLQDLEHFEKATDNFKKCAELNPSFADAFFHLGCLHFELKKYFEAGDYFQKAYKLNPENEEALFNWSVTKFYLQKYQESINGFDTIIDRFPLYTEAFIYKSQSLEKINHIKEALDCLNQFCENWDKKKFGDGNRPKRVQTMVIESRQDVEHGKTDYNIKEVEEVLSRNNSLLSDDDTLAAKNDFDHYREEEGSEKDYEEKFHSCYEEDFPQEVHLMRIRYTLILKDYNRALKIIESALIRNQSYSEGYFYKAVILNKLGRKLDVIEAITKAITVNPNNYFYYCFRGASHFYLSKEKCLNDFQKASKILNSKFENLYLENETLRTLNSYFLYDVKSYIPITTQIINYFDYLEKSIESFTKINESQLSRIDSIIKDYDLYHNKTYQLLNAIYDIRIGPEDKPEFAIELAEIEHKLSHMIRKYILIIPLIENNYSGQTLLEKLQSLKRNETNNFEYISCFHSVLIAYLKSFSDFKSLKQMSLIELEADLKVQSVLEDESTNLEHYDEHCKILIDNAIMENPFLVEQRRKNFMDVLRRKTININESVVSLILAKAGVQIVSSENKGNEIVKSKFSKNYKDIWSVFKRNWKKGKVIINTKKMFPSEPKQMALIDAVLLIDCISTFQDEFVSSKDPFDDQIVYTILSERHVKNFLENSEVIKMTKRSFLGNLLS